MLVHAQTLSGGWEISVSNVVSPSNPTATIEVRAYFEPVPGVADLFAWGDFSIIAPSGNFASVQLHLKTGYNQQLGAVVGSSVLGAFVAQLHFPPTVYGTTQNPVLTWSATWTTNDFTPRLVPTTTFDTTVFGVYAGQTGTSSPVPIANITHGQAMIQVIPAPASGVLLLPLLFRRARQRCP